MKSRRTRTKTTSRKGASESRRTYRKPAKTRRVAEPKPAARQAEPEALKDPLPPEERIRRNRAAAALLRKWMAEDSSYDEAVGAALEAMGESRVRFRENFD